MNGNLKIVLVAFLSFLAVLFIDLLVAPKVPWGVQTAIYWILLYCSWLIVFPVFMASRWSLRDVSKLFALNLIFWSIEDPLFYHLLGYSAFSPFPENPGMYPLMIYWWPAWFMLLGRFFAGSVILVYITMNSEWGAKKLRVPLTREEITWIFKVVLVITVAAVTFSIWYQHYSRADFGGQVLYEIDRSYKKEESTETIYRGTLEKMTIVLPLPAGGVRESRRYVLIRSQPNTQPLPLARFKRSRILDSYLGKEVEILGKTVWRNYRRELLTGRIREPED